MKISERDILVGDVIKISAGDVIEVDGILV